jgi:large subunit ribosomal protein L20
MVRITRGYVAAQRRKKNLNLAKGYRGSNSRLSTMAEEQIIQSYNFAYIGRRLKKRTFHRLWISRINAAARQQNSNYSSFIGALRVHNIFLNSKVLAYFAVKDIDVFNLLFAKFGSR